MRCVLNGTQYTNAGKVERPSCKFCSALTVSATEIGNAPFSRTCCMSTLNSAASFLCHGWIPPAEVQIPFRRELFKIPERSGEFLTLTLAHDCHYVDLFLDGSCLRPTDAHSRLATWGLVAWDGQLFQSIVNGGVPGWRQTSPRGEIWAAVAAMKFVVKQPKPCRLWIDNQQVYTMLQSWLDNQPQNLSKKRDANMWTLLRDQKKTCPNQSSIRA